MYEKNSIVIINYMAIDKCNGKQESSSVTIDLTNNNDYYSIVQLIDANNTNVPLANDNYETLCPYIQPGQYGNPIDLTNCSYLFPKEPINITLHNPTFPLMLQFAQAGGNFPDLSITKRLISKRKQLYQQTLKMLLSKPAKS